MTHLVCRQTKHRMSNYYTNFLDQLDRIGGVVFRRWMHDEGESHRCRSQWFSRRHPSATLPHSHPVVVLQCVDGRVRSLPPGVLPSASFSCSIFVRSQRAFPSISCTWAAHSSLIILVIPYGYGFAAAAVLHPNHHR